MSVMFCLWHQNYWQSTINHKLHLLPQQRKLGRELLSHQILLCCLKSDQTPYWSVSEVSTNLSKKQVVSDNQEKRLKIFLYGINSIQVDYFKVKQISETPIPIIKKEVTFKVKKSTMGRTGWKIMPEDESLNLKMNKDIMDQVLDRIRWKIIWVFN